MISDTNINPAELFLYHLQQADPRATGYDTYDSMVVAASSEAAARVMHPTSSDTIPLVDPGNYPYWTNDPSLVQVRYLGIADQSITEPCVICASFNAG